MWANEPMDKNRHYLLSLANDVRPTVWFVYPEAKSRVYGQV